MLCNNKCILVFGLSENEINALKMANLEIIAITLDMVNMKIGDIINGLRILTYENKIPKEKIILFNNFEESELKDTINRVRVFVKDGILATVTENTVNWSFTKLIKHLISEKEWINSN